MFKKIIIGILFIVLLSAVSVYVKQGIKGEDTSISFALEAYDKIIENYWAKPEDYSLPLIFELSFEKALDGSVDLESPKDREAVRNMIGDALKSATSTEAERDMVLRAIAIALYNLEPIGRNALFSEKAEKDLRNNVANVNPEKNLYKDLGLPDRAPISEVHPAYVKKEKELAKLPREEAVVEREKLAYAHEVLSESSTKALYDEFKAEPTVFKRVYPGVLYLNLSKIAPTTLWEFAYAINEASTTPLSSLVIDFRENVGGALDFLPALLGLFIGQDQHTFDLYSQGEKEVIRTTQNRIPELEPYKNIIFLVSSTTQSTAEITAETFRRYNLGKVVGETTRGWGTVENTFPLSTDIDPEEKYTLLLVHSITLRNDNQPIEGRGITPDLDTSLSNWRNNLSKIIQQTEIRQVIEKLIPQSPLR